MKCMGCKAAWDTKVHNPRILDCGHSMCAACIKGMGAKRNQYVCPQCYRRLRFNSPTQLLKVLPTNYALLEFVSNNLFKEKSNNLAESSIEINNSLLDKPSSL